MADLLDLIPRIKRARGFRLYDYGGRRYLDLYQNGGHSILGHGYGQVSRELKALISRGLLFDIPSIYEERLLRALGRQYPGFSSFQICASMDHALELISALMGERVSAQDIGDPALGEEGIISYSRPFLPIPEKASVLIPILPFEVGGSPVVVCFSSAAPQPGVISKRTISPLLLSGLLRAIHDLDAFERPIHFDESLLEGCDGWSQRGPYITAGFRAESYRKVFLRFLDEGVLLSPFGRAPSILPAAVSEGEMKKVIRLFKQFPEE